jgi:hypothetical protein
VKGCSSQGSVTATTVFLHRKKPLLQLLQGEMLHPRIDGKTEHHAAVKDNCVGVLLRPEVFIKLFFSGNA